jgi:hypothetical protein
MLHHLQVPVADLANHMDDDQGMDSLTVTKPTKVIKQTTCVHHSGSLYHDEAWTIHHDLMGEESQGTKVGHCLGSL